MSVHFVLVQTTSGVGSSLAVSGSRQHLLTDVFMWGVVSESVMGLPCVQMWATGPRQVSILEPLRKKWVLKKLGRVGPEKSILSRCAKAKEKGRQAPAMLLENCR